MEMDDDGKYQDWFNKNFDSNAESFAEKYDELFEEFCLNRFQQIGVDKYDEE
jgi:hypothetical protein